MAALLLRVDEHSCTYDRDTYYKGQGQNVTTYFNRIARTGKFILLAVDECSRRERVKISISKRVRIFRTRTIVVLCTMSQSTRR